VSIFQVGIGFLVYRLVLFFKWVQYLLLVFQNVAISVRYFQYFTLHKTATCRMPILKFMSQSADFNRRSVSS